MGHNIFRNTMVEMTWQEVERYAQDNAVVLLPLGVIEEHGPHMPLGTDIYIATAIAEKIKEVIEDGGIKTIIAPPFYWGMVSGPNYHFAGSFSSKKETIKLALHDIIESLKNAGFKNIIGLNYHGDTGHMKAIHEAFRESGEQLQVNVYWQTYVNFLPQQGLSGSEDYIIAVPFPDFFIIDNSYLDVHAGAQETNFMFEKFPDLVNIELAKTLKPIDLSNDDLNKWFNPHSDDKSLTPDGYLGHPSKYDEIMYSNDAMASHIANCIIAFLHNRNYSK